MDPSPIARVEQKGDATTYVVVEYAARRTMPKRHGSARPPFPPAASDFMNKLPMTMQRLILAFTTGLFLACAAHVSAQGDTIPLSSIEP